MQRRKFRHMHARCGPPPDGPPAHLSRDVTQHQLYWEDENLESVTSRRIHESERRSPQGQEASRVCRGAQILERREMDGRQAETCDE